MTDFGDKEFSGVGYPTPVSIPEDTTCLTLQVPADADWWALTVGVLFTLTAPDAWQQFEGGMSREDAAERWTTMFNDALDRAAGTDSCELDAPAPYWDDEDAQDADDQEDTAMEDWYGEVTFSEDGVPIFNGNRLEDWLIAGLVALVSGKNKAVRFLTSARQFRLYLRTGDYGGAVSIFFNGILATLVDTYSTSPGLREVPILTDGTPLLGMGAMDDLIEMLIVQGDHHDGVSTPQLQIVRKRLWAGEVSPTNLRYNADCDCIQQYYDPPGSWMENTYADPRSSPVYLMPPLSTGDVKCDAAANMVKWLKDFLDSVTELLGLGGLLVAVVNKLLEFLVILTEGAALLVDIIVEIAGYLFDLGFLALTAAFAGTEYDDLLCIFYCNMGSDGQVSAGQLVTIKSQVSSILNTTAAFVINALLDIQGFVGLSNAGVVGGQTGDCSACLCTWSHVVDLTISPYTAGMHDHFYIDTYANGFSTAFWHDGLGFGNRNDGDTDPNYLALAWIVLVFTASDGSAHNYKVTNFRWVSTEVPTGYSQTVYFDHYNPDTQTVLQDSGQVTPSDDVTYDYAGGSTTRAISTLQYQQYPHDPREVYTGYITTLYIAGTGDDPMPELP